jgi:hypothetical protein
MDCTRTLHVCGTAHYGHQALELCVSVKLVVIIFPSVIALYASVARVRNALTDHFIFQFLQPEKDALHFPGSIFRRCRAGEAHMFSCLFFSKK